MCSECNDWPERRRLGFAFIPKLPARTIDPIPTRKTLTKILQLIPTTPALPDDTVNGYWRSNTAGQQLITFTTTTPSTMKIATEDELAQLQAATTRGAVEGILAGLAVALPGSYYLHRRWAYYRSLPPAIKALGVVLIVAPAFAIQAERRGIQFDEEFNWTNATGKYELDKKAQNEVERWEKLSSWQKAGDWANRHKMPIFLGIWGTTMAGSWAVLRRHKTESFSQKIVQARVYAQGISIVTLLGGVFLTRALSSEPAQKKNEDHSWANIIEEQAREDRRLAHHATA